MLVMAVMSGMSIMWMRFGVLLLMMQSMLLWLMAVVLVVVVVVVVVDVEGRIAIFAYVRIQCVRAVDPHSQMDSCIVDRSRIVSAFAAN